MEAQPRERVVDVLQRLGDEPLAVRVLDAQHERAALCGGSRGSCRARCARSRCAGSPSATVRTARERSRGSLLKKECWVIIVRSARVNQAVNRGGDLDGAASTMPGVRISGRITGSSPAGGIVDVQGHAGPAEAGQSAGNGVVAVRPVRPKRRDPGLAQTGRDTAGLSRATLSFTWQVRHHFAVKSTNTGVPGRRSSSSRSGSTAPSEACDRGRERAARPAARAGAREARSRGAAVPPTTSSTASKPAADAHGVARRESAPHRPQIHAPRPAASIAPSKQSHRRSPASAASTEAIQTAAAIIGNAMTWRKVSIQGPGLRQAADTRPGTTESRRIRRGHAEGQAR